jgi:hypothetical protein
VLCVLFALAGPAIFLSLPFGLKNGLFQKGSANIEVACKLSQADAK